MFNNTIGNKKIRFQGKQNNLWSSGNKKFISVTFIFYGSAAGEFLEQDGEYDHGLILNILGIFW